MVPEPRTARALTDKFTESMYVLANEPSVALYRLQEHVRRSLPELAQHKSDMQSWEEQSQGAIYTVEYACSAIKNMTDSSVYFKSIDSLLKHAIAMKDQLNAAQGRRFRIFPVACVAGSHSVQPKAFFSGFRDDVAAKIAVSTPVAAARKPHKPRILQPLPDFRQDWPSSAAFSSPALCSPTTGRSEKPPAQSVKLRRGLCLPLCSQ
ncbi:hypothetical protein QYF61_016168 [Mycteria americana]|uniref:Protein MEF2BNB n=1 Tax=Mycteria americana TaxID=33587 RepID=A0AAN7N3E2_MYCAM|nr:hypothetical protein QYF61_016168 [Mycteria americana]